MDKLLRLSPYFNARLAFITAFGFASGLPLALTGSTLQAWLTEAHVSLMAIGVLSLMSFPYNFKFLWAPLLDRWVFPGLGRRRGWILLMQFLLALALVGLSFIEPQTQIHALGILVIVICFISATQDIAINAYNTDVLLSRERGLGSAYFIFAYRMAMFASGGLALVIASFWGWALMYQCMAGLMLLSMIATYVSPEPQQDKILDAQAVHPKKESLLLPFYDLFRRDNIALIMAFVVLYKAGAALAVALMTNFLLHGVGFTLIEIGLASKTAIIVGTILGAFVGGAFMYRLGLYASLLWFGVAQAASILLFMLLAIAGKSFGLMVLTVFTENFCSGMSTAAFLAFLMSLCNTRYSATQFAFLSAIDCVGRLVAGPLAAYLVLHFGWVSFYGWSFLVSLPAIFILLVMSKKVSFDAPAVSYS